VRRRKTDYGTIILHWLVVGAICVAFVTGLRIAAETPDRTWINWLDAVLPRAGVWVPHMEAAVVLTAVSIGYAIYLTRSGLTRRVAFDKIRLRGLVGRKQARFGSLSVLLVWTFYATMLALIVSGGLLYFGFSAGYDMVMIHWCATWIIPVFAVLHVLVHYAIGRSSQLLRIFHPDRVPPPPPRLDAVELLTMLVEKNSSAPKFQSTSKAPLQPAEPHDRRDPRRLTVQPGQTVQPGSKKPTPRRTAKPRNTTLQSNPFVVAAAVAITGASALVAADWLVIDTMRIYGAGIYADVWQWNATNGSPTGRMDNDHFGPPPHTRHVRPIRLEVE
jgi:hypothetical protein